LAYFLFCSGRFAFYLVGYFLKDEGGKGFLVFWITTISMVVMGLSFGVAGVLQSYMQRGLGMDFLTVQGFMKPWFVAVLFGGLGLFIGVILYIITVEQLAFRKA
jgi:ABC-type branched-subunit amino acid transport system permease subunit